MDKKILIILIALMFVLGVSKLSFAMMWMCGGKSNEHSGHHQTAQVESSNEQITEQSGTTETVKEAEDVGNKTCPVSGEKIDEKIKATYEYEGKIYNFCCPMCIEEFKKDPKKYIKKVEEELQAQTKEKGEATPESLESESMHEEHHH